jgi:hypothetical protein
MAIMCNALLRCYRDSGIGEFPINRREELYYLVGSRSVEQYDHKSAISSPTDLLLTYCNPIMSQTHYPVNYSSATTGDSFSDPISLGDPTHRDFGRGVVVASPTIGQRSKSSGSVGWEPILSYPIGFRKFSEDVG